MAVHVSCSFSSPGPVNLDAYINDGIFQVVLPTIAPSQESVPVVSQHTVLQVDLSAAAASVVRVVPRVSCLGRAVSLRLTQSSWCRSRPPARTPPLPVAFRVAVLFPGQQHGGATIQYQGSTCTVTFPATVSSAWRSGVNMRHADELKVRLRHSVPLCVRAGHPLS